MSKERTAAESSITDGALWRDFCRHLEETGQVVLREGSPEGAFDRAEGFRYLTRLLRLALEKFVEHNDPAAPRFYRLSHETAKIGCDNPDSFYQNAAIDGRYEYRLSGTRGTVAYLGIGAYYGHYGSSARSGCSGYLEAGDLEVDADGRFEITLSARPATGPNHIHLEPDASMLIVRQNFLDRSTEVAADLTLERIGADGPPAPLDPATFAAQLMEAAAYVRGTATLFANWAEGFAREPNTLPAMDPKVTGGAHGDPNIYFYMGYWQLGPDEALIIDLAPPDCEYWNFQLNNHWMESLDYRYHAIHYNKHTARAADHGPVRLVVAHRDPNRAANAAADAIPVNWVDTAGHERGTMGLRWVKAAHHPDPVCRVVARGDVAATPWLVEPGKQ
jgi:hypothetical protein